MAVAEIEMSDAISFCDFNTTSQMFPVRTEIDGTNILSKNQSCSHKSLDIPNHNDINKDDFILDVKEGKIDSISEKCHHVSILRSCM